MWKDSWWQRIQLSKFKPVKSNAVLWEFFHPVSIQDMSLCDIMLNVYCAISNIKITNFSLYFVPNSMLFVFSFLKWILSLLSINQSQIFEKNCLGFYWLYRYCCVDTRNKSRLHGLIGVLLSVTILDLLLLFLCVFLFLYLNGWFEFFSLKTFSISLVFLSPYSSYQL